eukprot:COSAG01_NODE_67097_length_268_cov_0.609467_1_plen_45_part_10
MMHIYASIRPSTTGAAPLQGRTTTFFPLNLDAVSALVDDKPMLIT